MTSCLSVRPSVWFVYHANRDGRWIDLEPAGTGQECLLLTAELPVTCVINSADIVCGKSIRPCKESVCGTRRRLNYFIPSKPRAGVGAPLSLTEVNTILRIRITLYCSATLPLLRLKHHMQPVPRPRHRILSWHGRVFLPRATPDSFSPGEPSKPGPPGTWHSAPAPSTYLAPST